LGGRALCCRFFEQGQPSYLRVCDHAPVIDQITAYRIQAERSTKTQGERNVREWKGQRLTVGEEAMAKKVVKKSGDIQNMGAANPGE
jgi:hypothetical protein